MAHLSAQVRGMKARKSIQPGQVLLLGRHRDCDVVVGDDRASRRHAEIFWPEGASAPRVRDRGSSNGTFVNGEEVSDDVELADGAMITLGSPSGEPVIIEYGSAMGKVANEATAVFPEEEGELHDSSDKPTEGYSRTELGDLD